MGAGNQQGTEAASGWGPSILPDGGVRGRTGDCILQTSFRGSTPRKIWVGPLPGFMQMRLRWAVLYPRGEQPRPHSGSAAPAAAHAPCGISSQMGGTGDGRPRGGAAPPRAHPVCGAGGGRGLGPATPSTQHRREGVRLLSKGTERAASCFARRPLPCQMEAGRPPPQSPSTGFLRDSACSVLAAGAPKAMETPALPACDFHLPAGGRAGVSGEETLPPALPAQVLAPRHLPPAWLQVPKPPVCAPPPAGSQGPA